MQAENGAWCECWRPAAGRSDAGIPGNVCRRVIVQHWRGQGDMRAKPLRPKAARHRDRRQIGKVDETRVHAKMPKGRLKKGGMAPVETYSAQTRSEVVRVV
jgi:hypothetical protein